MSLTVFSKLMLNYLKKKECKKGNCEPVKSVTYLYEHVWSMPVFFFVSIFVCVFVFVFFFVCVCVFVFVGVFVLNS